MGQLSWWRIWNGGLKRLGDFLRCLFTILMTGSSSVHPMETDFTEMSYVELLDQKRKAIERLDFETAKQDVLPFVADKSKLELWSAEFFKSITQSLKIM